jgi:hypothetical protein
LRISAGLSHPAIHLPLVGLANFKAEGHVLVDRHVRIERIGLEHHGDLAVGGRQARSPAAADPDLAAAHRFKALR